jgi:site-specific DNA recombinase
MLNCNCKSKGGIAMKQAIGYCRVSTDGQIGEDKFGLEAQKEQIKLYALSNGYEIVAWSTDEGISGATLDRPALNDLLYGEVGNPPIEAVIVAKNDRMSRDMEQYFYVKYSLKKKNISLKSVSEDFGQMGVFSNVMESLAMFIAEQERINIAKRTSGGRKLKAASGGYSGGRAPYGYKIHHGQYEVVPEEAGMVKKIFELLGGGMNLTDTAEWLNSNGYATRNGKRFYASHIKAIKENRPVYEGYYKYGNMDWVRGVHEAILREGI